MCVLWTNWRMSLTDWPSNLFLALCFELLLEVERPVVVVLRGSSDRATDTLRTFSSFCLFDNFTIGEGGRCICCGCCCCCSCFLFATLKAEDEETADPAGEGALFLGIEF